MPNRSKFEADFIDSLTEVGDILSQNGYDIAAYTGNLKIGGVKAAGHADSPEKALEETLNDIDEDELIMAPIPRNKVGDVYKGQDLGLEEVLYSNLHGFVEVEEPLVDWSKDPENMTDVDPSADPTVDENIGVAFGLNVEYHPNRAGQGHWEVESLGTAPAYSLEEAKEEINQIAQVLEENGVEYKIGPAN